jgi:hypothetical protein
MTKFYYILVKTFLNSNISSFLPDLLFFPYPPWAAFFPLFIGIPTLRDCVYFPTLPGHRL